MEDGNIIERTFQCQDNYYELFNVSKHSENFEKELRFSFMKLSIKIHPDKNKHPRAEEAFKIINDGYNTLKDPVKRLHYDHREAREFMENFIRRAKEEKARKKDEERQKEKEKEEDENIIERIFQCQDNYYKLFNISKHSENFEKELRFSFMKLSRKIHPDKNKHPRAEEAFKIINDGYNTLKDPAKRNDYDNREVREFMENLIRRAKEDQARKEYEERQKENEEEEENQFSKRESERYERERERRRQQYEDQVRPPKDTEPFFTKKTILIIVLFIFGLIWLYNYDGKSRVEPFINKPSGNKPSENKPKAKKSTNPPKKNPESKSSSNEIEFVVQLDSQRVFDQKCNTALKKFCVIVFLPLVEDCNMGCRFDTLKMVSGLSKKYSHLTWDWMWTKTGALPDLEEAIFQKIQNKKFPALVSISIRQGKFWILSPSKFDVENIEYFMELEKGTTFKIPKDGLPDVGLPKTIVRDPTEL